MRWWKKRCDSLLPYVPHLDYETIVRRVCYNKTALPSCLMGDFFLYAIDKVNICSSAGSDYCRFHQRSKQTFKPAQMRVVAVTLILKTDARQMNKITTCYRYDSSYL